MLLLSLFLSWSLVFPVGAHQQTARWVSLLNSAYEEFSTNLPTVQGSVVEPFTEMNKRVGFFYFSVRLAVWLNFLCTTLEHCGNEREWFESVKRLFSSKQGSTKQYFEEEGRLFSLGKWSVWKMVRNGFFTYALRQHNTCYLYCMCSYSLIRRH